MVNRREFLKTALKAVGIVAAVPVAAKALPESTQFIPDELIEKAMYPQVWVYGNPGPMPERESWAYALAEGCRFEPATLGDYKSYNSVIITPVESL